MKIIKPDSISGEIMDLITSAKKQVIIITPYHEITGWDKLINKLRKAQLKGINIIWYSRNGVKQKYPNELWKLFNIKPLLIDDLHAKIYMNEVCAVITSMNLCKKSDDKSTDVGHITQNQEEFNDICSFYESYIKVTETQPKIEPIKKYETTQTGIQVKRNPNKISDTYAINGIHEHINNKYRSHRYKFIKGRNLEYIDFIWSDYCLNFELFEEAIKVLIQMPKKDIKTFDYEKKIDFYKNKVIFKKELEYWESMCCIKYYYKSNLIIKNWEKQQLDLFLKDLDAIIEMTFSK